MTKMAGERDLYKLLKTMKPIQNVGDYVFCVVNDLSAVNLNDIIFIFREKEGNTIIIKKELADHLSLECSFLLQHGFR